MPTIKKRVSSEADERLRRREEYQDLRRRSIARDNRRVEVEAQVKAKEGFISDVLPAEHEAAAKPILEELAISGDEHRRAELREQLETLNSNLEDRLEAARRELRALRREVELLTPKPGEMLYVDYERKLCNELAHPAVKAEIELMKAVADCYAPAAARAAETLARMRQNVETFRGSGQQREMEWAREKVDKWERVNSIVSSHVREAHAAVTRLHNQLLED